MTNPIDREHEARVHGYTGLFGAKTWDACVRDFYEFDPSLSKTTEAEVKTQVGHVAELTGDPGATLDPTLPSLNRIA